MVSEVFLSLVHPEFYILELRREGYTSVGEIVGMNNLRSRFSDMKLKHRTQASSRQCRKCSRWAPGQSGQHCSELEIQNRSRRTNKNALRTRNCMGN